MPIYEYVCVNGHKRERFLPMRAELEIPCDVCGAKSARQISAPALFDFRGSGFYAVDYKGYGKLDDDPINGAKNK